jgi:predicted component of type VI protein secretion system
MAYLILSIDGNEWNRLELSMPIVLGRSPDCDISVHDILLSRHHCRITPAGDGWLLIDMASRNGTTVGDKTVEQCILKHGDVIRAGKNKITFRTDKFIPMVHRAARPQLPPAINREDSLASTVVGMQVPVASIEPAPVNRSMHRPTPKPRPMDPESFATDDLYSMLEQIASSSWDSIYAVNAQPLRRDRVLPQPIVGGVKLRPSRPQMSMELQLASSDRHTLPARPAPKIRRRFVTIHRFISRLGRLRLL